jgi:hypothetical protein
MLVVFNSRHKGFPKVFLSFLVSLFTIATNLMYSKSLVSIIKHVNKQLFFKYTNSCAYNYSIKTINSTRNNALMNKILCFIYFTIDIIRHSQPDISINTSISGDTTNFIPSFYLFVSYTSKSSDI